MSTPTAYYKEKVRKILDTVVDVRIDVIKVKGKTVTLKIGLADETDYILVFDELGTIKIEEGNHLNIKTPNFKINLEDFIHNHYF